VQRYISPWRRPVLRNGEIAILSMYFLGHIVMASIVTAKTVAVDYPVDFLGNSIEYLRSLELVVLSNGDIVLSWGDGYQVLSGATLPFEDNPTGGGTIRIAVAPDNDIYATFLNGLILDFSNNASPYGGGPTAQLQSVSSPSVITNGAVAGLSNGNAAVTWYSNSSGNGVLYSEVVNGTSYAVVGSPINLGPSTGLPPAMTALPNGGYAVA
jgi:hypothetical protein